MSQRHHRDYSYDYPSLHSQQYKDTISELQQEKATLRAALQSALSQRDELREEIDEFQEKYRKLLLQNDQLRIENEGLMRRHEDSHKEMNRQREEYQRTSYQFAEKMKALEELGNRRNAHCAHGGSVNKDILKYTKFVLENLENQPKLNSLFSERVHGNEKFWTRVTAQQYDICLLRVLQFISDFLVVLSPKKPEKAQNTHSIGSQTLVETGTNTEKYHWSEGPAILTSTESSSHGGELPLPVVKYKGDYERLMQESELLLSSLHRQSDRLARLNSHIHDTMRVNSPLLERMSPSRIGAISPIVVLSPSQKETIEESPQSEELIGLQRVTEELTSPTEEAIEPQSPPFQETPPTEPPPSARKPKSRLRKQFHPAPNKIDVPST